jgi:hypothetical protein
MTVAAALALLVASASPSGLDEARRAFAAGDYASAERLALEAAADDPAPALYLAGLARFRAGRPAEALEALDRSEAGADSPAAWRFNRGACLYELGRHAEAEAAFLGAAADPAFEALALVNAGFAALDGGAPERARELAARARASAAGGPALGLVEELEQALEPAPGGAPAPAPAASPSPPASGSATTTAATVWARAESGWDDDALRAGTGAVERPGSAPEVQSGFVAAGVGAQLAAPVGNATVVAGYGLEQLAYLEEAAQDYSVQQHDLLLAVRARRGSSLLLEAALFGQYALTGLSDLRGMQAAGGLRLAAALEWGGRQTTHALVGATAKDGRGEEFAPLDGSRLEVVASHDVRLDPLLLVAGYRFQLERIGEVTTVLPPLPAGSPICPVGCTATGVEPLSYAGHTGWVGLRVEPRPWLRIDVTGGVEGRSALDDLRTVLTTPGGAETSAGRRHRSDLRGFGSEMLALRLAADLHLTLRHEWLVNRTRLEPASSGSGPGARGTATSTWDKHVLGAGVAVEW